MFIKKANVFQNNVVHENGAITVDDATRLLHPPIHLRVRREPRQTGEGSGEKVDQCWFGMRSEEPRGRAIRASHQVSVAGR
jgi:hypothetical protein